MAMIHVITKFSTTKLRYGYKDLGVAKASKTAGASKIAKLLKTKVAPSDKEGKDASKTEEPKKRVLLDLDHVPKPYGSHDGNTHAAILYKGSADVSAVLEIIKSADRAALYIENQPSIDTKSMKRQIEDQDSATAKEFRLKYGISLTAEQMGDLISQQSKHARTYYRSQVTMILYSKEMFPGAKEDKERKLFILTVTCKAMNTIKMPAASIVKDLKDLIAGTSKLAVKGVAIGEYICQINDQGNCRFITRVPEPGSGLTSRTKALRIETSWEDFTE